MTSVQQYFPVVLFIIPCIVAPTLGCKNPKIRFYKMSLKVLLAPVKNNSSFLPGYLFNYGNEATTEVTGSKSLNLAW